MMTKIYEDRSQLQEFELISKDELIEQVLYDTNTEEINDILSRKVKMRLYR